MGNFKILSFILAFIANHVFSESNPTAYFNENCEIVTGSRSAKLTPHQIDEKLRDDAIMSIIDPSREPWYHTKHHKTRNFEVKKAVNEQYPLQLCNDREFSPSVVQLKELISCYKICEMCFPGSISICLLRDVRFVSMGETCLCTYSTQNPISDAAFSLRHDKRVFSRRSLQI